VATELLDREALPRLIDAGKFSQAAKLHNEIAELLEQDGQYDVAIVNFQKAADYFAAENSASSSQKAMVRVAHLSAQLDPPEFGTAAETFARVGQESMSNALLKFQAKGFFFNAVLCTLAQGDVVAADANLGRYKDIDYTFPGSRECKLCEDIIQSCKDMNAEAFTDAVYNFDQISKLDPWKTS